MGYLSHHQTCFQIITGLQLMHCELRYGNTHPIACCVGASSWGKAWHCNTHNSHVKLLHLTAIWSHTCGCHHHQKVILVNTTLAGSVTVSAVLMLITMQDTHLNFREQKALLPMALVTWQEKNNHHPNVDYYIQCLISVCLFGKKSVKLHLEQNSR